MLALNATAEQVQHYFLMLDKFATDMGLSAAEFHRTAIRNVQDPTIIMRMDAACVAGPAGAPQTPAPPEELRLNARLWDGTTLALRDVAVACTSAHRNTITYLRNKLMSVMPTTGDLAAPGSFLLLLERFRLEHDWLARISASPDASPFPPCVLFDRLEQCSTDWAGVCESLDISSWTAWSQRRLRFEERVAARVRTASAIAARRGRTTAAATNTAAAAAPVAAVHVPAQHGGRRSRCYIHPRATHTNAECYQQHPHLRDQRKRPRERRYGHNGPNKRRLRVPPRGRHDTDSDNGDIGAGDEIVASLTAPSPPHLALVQDEQEARLDRYHAVVRADRPDAFLPDTDSVDNSKAVAALVPTGLSHRNRWNFAVSPVAPGVRQTGTQRPVVHPVLLDSGAAVSVIHRQLLDDGPLATTPRLRAATPAERLSVCHALGGEATPVADFVELDIWPTGSSGRLVTNPGGPRPVRVRFGVLDSMGGDPIIVALHDLADTGISIAVDQHGTTWAAAPEWCWPPLYTRHPQPRRLVTQQPLATREEAVASIRSTPLLVSPPKLEQLRAAARAKRITQFEDMLRRVADDAAATLPVTAVTRMLDVLKNHKDVFVACDGAARVPPIALHLRHERDRFRPLHAKPHPLPQEEMRAAA